MKKYARFLTFLLIFALCLSLLPVTALAAGGDLTEIWVGGVQMKSGYYLPSGNNPTAASLTTTKPTSGGYAYAFGSFLRLHNYSYSGNSDYGIYYTDTDSLRIEVEENNRVCGKNAGIVAANGSLYFYYSGTLSSTGDASQAIYAYKDVSISDITLTAEGADVETIYCNDSITIEDSTVTTTGGDYGINSPVIHIEDSTVTTTGNYNGVNSTNTTVIDSIVTASGGFHGINAGSSGSISFMNSTVTVSGGIAALNKAPILNQFSTWKLLAGASASNATTVSAYGSQKYAKFEATATELSKLWLGGVRMPKGYYLPSGNTPTVSSLTKIQPSGGYAYLSEDGKTLTLNRYNFYGEEGVNDVRNAIDYISSDTLNLILQGTSYVRGLGYGVISDGNLAVSGDGTLIAEGDEFDGIFARRDVSITGVSVTPTGSERYGIANNGHLSIRDSRVTAKGLYRGIASQGSIDISDSKVNASGQSGIYVVKDFSITNSTVTTTGTLDYGIDNGGTTSLTDSTLTATGDEAALNKAPTLSAFNTWKITAGASASNASAVSSYSGEKYAKHEATTSGFLNCWVGGVRMAEDSYLPSGNSPTARSLTKTKPSGGYAHLSKDGTTLTLYNYSYSGQGYADGDNYAIYTTYALHIVVQGTNSLQGAGGIYAYNRANIIGGGTLTVTGVTKPGVFANHNIYIGNCTVNATGLFYGIAGNAAVIVTDSTVSAAGGLYGILSGDALTLSGSTVTATGGEAALSKAPTLSGDYTITAGGSAAGAALVSAYTNQKYAKFAPKSGEITGSNPFTDVKETDYFYQPVLWAVGEGVTNGTTPTTFEPNATCTRAQAVTFLWRANGSPEPGNSNNPFTDVKAGGYYYKAVLWAVEKGITNGTSATTFSPNDTCTRGQIVTFQWRGAGQPTPGSSINPFTDVKSGDYYYNAVLWAVEKGVTNGVSATTFSPNDFCTRGQIVTFLYRQLAN